MPHLTLPADLETPVGAFLKVTADQPYSFLFESIEGGKFRGRYSFFGCGAETVWTCRGNRAQVDAVDDGPALASLKRFVKVHPLPVPDGLPPMAAGVYGYLGYAVAALAENIPQTKPDPLGIPDGVLFRPALVGVFDHVQETLTLVASSGEKLEQAVARLGQALPLPKASTPAAAVTATANMSKEGYEQAVRVAQDYIRAGDIFQVVPSQRFTRPYTLPPFSLYRSLRQLNPSPFLFYLNFGGFQLVGSSPEILVRLQGGTVTVRPIAGTRRRGATPEEDKALAADLLADAKERAEHLMLLDLGRNDVGRVAEPASVRVTDSFFIEHYSHVMHIVSNVEGKLRAGCDAVDALLAGFPAGTVSGAPKIRAMQILDELEPVRRSFYGGAVGYFSANGEMDTCIALRTGLIKDGLLHVQAGAGVVADSIPSAEHQETVNKAQALLKAADGAGRFGEKTYSA